MVAIKNNYFFGPNYSGSLFIWHFNLFIYLNVYGITEDTLFCFVTIYSVFQGVSIFKQTDFFWKFINNIVLFYVFLLFFEIFQHPTCNTLKFLLFFSGKLLAWSCIVISISRFAFWISACILLKSATHILILTGSIQ